MSCALSSLGDLNADIQNHWSLSVAASTRKTYSSGERRFLDFCILHSPLKSTHIPTDEETLIQYVAYLAKTIKHSSINGYLAAVRHIHVRSGYELDLRKFVHLQLICVVLSDLRVIRLVFFSLLQQITWNCFSSLWLSKPLLTMILVWYGQQWP